MGGTPAVDAEDLQAQVRRAWASLLDRCDAIADDITLTLMERDEQWYEYVPELQADVRQSTREHVRRGIRTMAGIADEDERAVHVWRETGRRRAQQGVPMELVLNAYTLGTRVLWEALLAQRHDPTIGIDDEVLLTAGQRAWSALDVQNATLIDSYRRESARLQRRDLQRQQRLLDALVEGRGSDPEFAAEVREVLGVATDAPVACVVAHYDGSLDAPLRAPEDHLERAGLMSYWHVRGDLYFGLVQLGESNVADLVALLDQITTGRAGVAEAPDGLGGFCTAYQLAAGTVETLPRTGPAVAAVTDRLPEVLLTSAPDVTNLLVERTIGPLRGQQGQQADVLLATLAALVAHNGSPTHAAEELYCHRNTVIYRMRQIAELTGRDLADPRERLLFSLALMAADE
ncbi:PucR family transcriptional regulator [Solicola gregarius]|uniref:Helix-turn-helix domain-containing protein n=1 Tax=Solicola gregarius TaxID=2908642 RepID=A0AA46YIZ1_9ACTN|nr:helix-turn-helix domain-containing protein [Solicola gregarius]UYM03597.1 helix-turn-helix domain-containing protein [Solicola gregarius]